MKGTNPVSFISPSVAVLQKPKTCLWTELEQHAAAETKFLARGCEPTEDDGRFTGKVLSDK